MYTFAYHHPTTLRQAVNLLAKTEDAKLLAGGHSLIPVMKLRLAKPTAIIDLSRVEGMSGVELKGRSVVIGAMTKHDAVANPQVLKDAMPALAAVPDSIGDPQVRNVGTIGGSIANNDPNADYPAACLGLGAAVITNKRRIGADEFFTGMFDTALAPDEIITKIQFPRSPRRPRTRSSSTRPPASRWSACSCRSAAPRSASPSPAPAPTACSGSRASRRRSRSASPQSRWRA